MRRAHDRPSRQRRMARAGALVACSLLPLAAAAGASAASVVLQPDPLPGFEPNDFRDLGVLEGVPTFGFSSTFPPGLKLVITDDAGAPFTGCVTFAVVKNAAGVQLASASRPCVDEPGVLRVRLDSSLNLADWASDLHAEVGQSDTALLPTSPASSPANSVPIRIRAIAPPRMSEDAVFASKNQGKPIMKLVARVRPEPMQKGKIAFEYAKRKGAGLGPFTVSKTVAIGAKGIASAVLKLPKGKVFWRARYIPAAGSPYLEAATTDAVFTIGPK